jgi:hypothetical protein
MIEIFRPARACIVRIAPTTNSPLTCTSLVAWSGRSMVHHGIPRWSSAGW